MPRLVSVGNVIVDIVLQVDALPEPGGDVLARGSEITAGGGLNTMVAAQRDGLAVVFGGQYGSGPFASIVRGALAANGVDVVQPGLEDLDSGYCVALVDASTERTFVTTIGAEARLGPDDLARIPVERDDIVFVSGYGLVHPMNGAAITQWLPRLPDSVRVVFDPSPLVGSLPPAILGAVLRRAHVVSANAREAGILTSTSAADLSRAAAGLAALARGTAIVRDGGAGCWVVDGGRAPVLVPGFAVEAVDSNGAGDAHDGVLAAALSRGSSLVDAARRANAAAALAVTRRGPATAPTAAEIDALLLRPTSGRAARPRRVADPQ